VEKKYLRLEDVAEQYSLEVRHLRIMCRRREVRASKVGRKWFVAPGDIDRVFREGVQGGKHANSK
jgi:hypothetical protein